MAIALKNGWGYLPESACQGTVIGWGLNNNPLLEATIAPPAIPGKDGDDVPPYLEKQLKKLLASLEELREDEDS